MSSKSNSSVSSSATARRTISTPSSIYREWGGYYSFALSYGLRPGRDDEDIRAIAEELARVDNENPLNEEQNPNTEE
jgi:hypothetical protein